MNMTRNERPCSSLYRAISHDMRTSLAGIMNHSTILQKDWALLSDSEKLANVSFIHKEADWLTRRMEDLLAITHIRENDLTLHINEELVEEVVSEAVRKLEPRFPDRDIQVRIPSDYIFLPMDGPLIEQAIIRLSENALSYSDSTKPVEILVKDEPDMVSFIVRGCNVSLPDSLLHTLFDGTFFTTSHAADAQKGMVMRLAVCQAILDVHQGTLQVRTHSQGADFIFTLPKKRE